MKISIIFLLLCSFVFGGDLVFEHDYKTALQKASKYKKQVMMIYSAPWCPECSYMKDVAFKETKLNSYITKKFVLLDLDIQKDKLPQGFSYVGIPTFFILDKNGKQVGKLIGGDKSNNFLERLKEIK